MKEIVKLVIFVPETHADLVRQSLGDVGIGVIGNYHHCSFSIKGIGRFIPGEGANPTIGEVGAPEAVEEERIEIPVDRSLLQKALETIRQVHPYEEPVIEVYPMLSDL